jgi:hypothetical protein
MSDDLTLAAALDYLARGWSVLPLCPHNHVGVGKGHRGCSSPGKRPFFPDTGSGEWMKYQTEPATPEQVTDWWRLNKLLNVGMALGPVSGLVGIDVDDEDGETLLAELAGGEIPVTWEYTTGKGRRLLYRLLDGVTVTNHSYRRPGTEIEILRFMGRGGQVVLPPSVHPNGAVYRWVEGRGPDDIEPADVPDWMRGTPKREDASASRPVDGELITEGGRNNYLTSLAGAMRKRGADEHVILAALTACNETRLDPQLPEAEVLTIARSVARYAPDEYTGVTIKFTPPGGPTTTAKPDPARRFKWASELAVPDKADEWVWKGYLPKGGITLLSALWKAGKTTLLAHLLRACATDGLFLGQEIKAARVLYVSEEGERHWVRRRDDLGLSDYAGFYLQPFSTKPNVADWLSFVATLKRDIQEHQFDLVVFDTLAKLWPVREENDPVEVDSALMPLWELTSLGAGVLLIHHLRKSGSTEFSGSRGSGALSAFPDILVELTRFDPLDNKCRKRKLSAKGRYDETPDELVIELVDGEYRHIPEPGEGYVPTPRPSPTGGVTLTVGKGGVSTEEHKVLHVLETSIDPWVQIEDIRAMLKATGWGLRNEDVNTHLFSLIDRNKVVYRGVVRSKAKPREYALATRAGSGSPPLCQGNEIPGTRSGDESGSRSQPSRSLNTQGRDEMDSGYGDDSPEGFLLFALAASGPKSADELAVVAECRPDEVPGLLAPFVESGRVVVEGDVYRIVTGGG